MASQLKILLLQARKDDDPARIEEVESFAHLAELPVDSLTPHSLLNGPPDRDVARRYDAIFIGGSGEYYVSNRDLPHQDLLFGELREWVALKRPLFASCFGFQCLVEALGGSIVYDPEVMEVGTHELELTEEGRQDELIGTLPSRFRAQMGHKDRAERLPEGIPNLASSRQSPFQAFRIPGAPIWATQFHPELDWQTNKGRLLRYAEGYSSHMAPDEFQATLRSFRPSPESNRLLVRFLRLVFG